jgi:hypothetical protein
VSFKCGGIVDWRSFVIVTQDARGGNGGIRSPIGGEGEEVGGVDTNTAFDGESHRGKRRKVNPRNQARGRHK